MTDMRIPQGWHSVPIGDCIVEREKSQIKVDNAAGYGNYPFFTSGEVVLKHTEKQIEGENIFLSTGGNAVVKYYDGEAAYSTDTYVVAGKKYVFTKFLYYALDFLTEYINTNYFQGSGLKHLQKKDFKRHELIIPSSLEEQKRIANALTQIDDAIDSSSRLIAKYELVKKGLMHDLLTYGIDKDGNIRSEQTHQFKDSPIGRIPVEWEVANFALVSGYKENYIKTGPFGSSLKGEHWRETGVPVITIGSIGEDNFIDENLLFIDESKAQELSAYSLVEGDILFSRVADIGRSLIIDKQHEGWVMSSNFMRLRIDVSIINPLIINIIIKYSDDFKKQICEKVNSSGRSVTNTNILNSFIFPLMSKGEQRSIIVLYDEINTYLQSIISKKRNLIDIRSGLLSDLMTGKVRI